MRLIDVAISTSPLILGDGFKVVHLDLIQPRALRVWFNKQPASAAVANKYALDGTAPALAQIVTTLGTPYLAVDLYFSSDLSGTQHTLTIANTITVDGPSPAQYLPATEIVFSIAADLSEPNQLDPDNSIKSFLPRQFKNKTGWDALIYALQYGDELVGEQARETYKQLSIATATGESLTKKTKDQGVDRPSKVGLNDESFRQLAISVLNDKLTSQSILSVLEVLYGESSTHAYLESAWLAPFRVFEGADLLFKVDGKIESRFLVDTANFQNPLQVTAQELCAAMNAQFVSQEANCTAKVLTTTYGDKIRVFSNTRGSGSLIQCLGGTLQPNIGLNQSLHTEVGQQLTYGYQTGPIWDVTTPSTGITRFTVDYTSPGTTEVTNLRVGDIVVINGPQFDASLWGTHTIVNVGYERYDTPPYGVIDHKYFDIEA